MFLEEYWRNKMETSREQFDRQFSEMYDRAMALTGREILINREAYKEAGEIFYSLYLDSAMIRGHAEHELNQRLKNGLTATSENEITNETLKNVVEEFTSKVKKVFGEYKRVCDVLKLPATSIWCGRRC